MERVEYKGKSYQISDEASDALADFGAEVAAGEMTSDEAIFTVLRAEGLIEIPSSDYWKKFWHHHEADIRLVLKAYNREEKELEELLISDGYNSDDPEDRYQQLVNALNYYLSEI